MSRLTIALPWCALLACSGSAAWAQSNSNVRGTFTAFYGKAIAVATREGKSVEVLLPDTVNVSGSKAFTLAGLQPGAVLGVTTIKRADGQIVAIDVRPIPSTARLGLSSFDLQPESKMANAVLEGSVVSADHSELTLDYREGTVKVLVPPGTPMSQSVPGSRADLKAGETVFIVARQDADGKLTALRVQVSTNGVKPTQ